MSERDPFFNPNGTRYTRGRGIAAGVCACLICIGLVILVIAVAMNPGGGGDDDDQANQLCTQLIGNIPPTVTQNQTQQCAANFTTGLSGVCANTNATFATCRITNFFINQTSGATPRGITSCTVPIAACKTPNCAVNCTTPIEFCQRNLVEGDSVRLVPFACAPAPPPPPPRECGQFLASSVNNQEIEQECDDDDSVNVEGTCTKVNICTPILFTPDSAFGSNAGEPAPALSCNNTACTAVGADCSCNVPPNRVCIREVHTNDTTGLAAFPCQPPPLCTSFVASSVQSQTEITTCSNNVTVVGSCVGSGACQFTFKLPQSGVPLNQLIPIAISKTTSTGTCSNSSCTTNSGSCSCVVSNVGPVCERNVTDDGGTNLGTIAFECALPLGVSK